MTNTKFRKRALLSSVAMLIVALIALGSATFAWFQANPSVSASALKMNATAGAGLQVASDYVIGTKTGDALTAAYDYTTTLSDGTTALPLDPASPYYSESRSTSAVRFASVGGTDAATKTAKGTFVETTPYTLGDTAAKVFYEDIYIKTTNGDSKTVGSALVRITSTVHENKAIEQGVKVALVTSDGTIIGIWKAASGQDSDVWKGTTTANTPASDLETLSTSPYKTNNTSAAITGVSADGKVKGDSGCCVIRMYVYLDGENNNVISNNALTATELFSAIDVVFSTEASISPLT